MIMKHGNIAIFVPHNGCPHRCSFCNQRSITGVQYQPTEKDIDEAVKTAVSYSDNYEYEIAFFGGSFTAINREYMMRLLDCAYKYVQEGTVNGIRISTRPDAIDEDILDILKSRGVTAIELGAQSMSDKVLKANLRGHTADDVKRASHLIKEYGFSLGLQMMTGLYQSDFDTDVYSAREIISLKPDTVRIYPTVTLDKTMLGELYRSGEYQPPELLKSVNLCALLLKMFSENNIEVIRLGLHYSDDLKSGMLYDNYHAAFKELCESKLMLDEFLELCETKNIPKDSSLIVAVNPKSISKFVGQKRSNITKLHEIGYDVKVVQDERLKTYELRIF